MKLEAVDKRIDDLRTDTNTRFGELRSDMNRRFEIMQFWLQLVFGAILVILGGLVSQWLLIWKRLIKVEATVQSRQGD
ncbi:MAG: hypothetical protein ONB05_01885 [candidate division KSB1 bacterium]|nr:hypothetical protein [candidate division KSB1 bacterium]